MSAGPLESGRTRLVVTVVLAVLIGTAGAFLLPVLIHEAEPPAPTGFRAEIGFLVPAGGLPAGGVFHVQATHPDGARLEVEEGIPRNATSQAVVGLLADAIGDATWPEGAAPTVAGNLLSFPLVTRIGGAPGDHGVPMTLSVAGRPGQALDLLLAMHTWTTSEAPSGRMRVALTVRGTVAADASSAGADGTVTTDWMAPEEAWKALRQRMVAGGWELSAPRTPATPGVRILALPDGSEPSALILTVEHEGDVRPAVVWSLALAR